MLGRVVNALKHRRLWLAYLVVSVVAVVIGAAEELWAIFVEGASWRQALSSILSPLLLIPLYGYVYQKKIRPRWLWSTVLIVMGTVLAVLLIMAAFWSVESSDARLVLLVAGVVLCTAPNLVAIHQYVHNRNIWNAT